MRVGPLGTGRLDTLSVERGQLVDAGTPLFAQDAIAERAARDRDAIDFPKEDEIWLDEVEHYQVQAKGCQQRQGVKL